MCVCVCVCVCVGGREGGREGGRGLGGVVQSVGWGGVAGCWCVGGYSVEWGKVCGEVACGLG